MSPAAKAERDRILGILDRAAATLSPSSAAVDEAKVRLLAALRREIAAPPLPLSQTNPPRPMRRASAASLVGALDDGGFWFWKD